MSTHDDSVLPPSPLEAGIGFDANADGSTTYFARIPDGKRGAKKRKLFKVEKRTKTTDTRARKEGRELRDPKSGVAKTENWTLTELKDFVFALIEKEIANDDGKQIGIGQTHYEGLQSRWKNRIEPYPIARMKIDRIDWEAATDWATEIYELRKTNENPDGLAPRTIKRIHDCMGTIVRLGRLEGKWDGPNPFRDISPRLKPKVEEDDEESNVREGLEPGLLPVFISGITTREFVERRTDGRMDVITFVCAVYGNRAGEFRAWRWRDLGSVSDGEGNSLPVIVVKSAMKGARSEARRGRTKSGKQTTHYLPPVVMDWMVSQLAYEQSKGRGSDDDYCFTREVENLPLSKYQLEDAVQAAGKIAGLGHVTPNNLRHTSTDAVEHTDIPLAERAQMFTHSVAVHQSSYSGTYATAAQLRSNLDKKARVLGLDLGTSESEA